MSTTGRGRLRHMPGHVTFLSLKLHFLKLSALKIFEKEVLWENYRPHGMIPVQICASTHHFPLITHKKLPPTLGLKESTSQNISAISDYQSGKELWQSQQSSILCISGPRNHCVKAMGCSHLGAAGWERGKNQSTCTHLGGLLSQSTSQWRAPRPWRGASDFLAGCLLTPSGI